MRFRVFQTLITSIVFCLTGLQVAQACMGNSRTINVRSFNAFLGTNGSGGIGLRPKEVVLTFDDGPRANSTPRVLAALDRECLKATFFVVGKMARANPKLLQRIARSGHTIGHHSLDHSNLTRSSLSSAQRNIQRGISSVRSALGPYKGRSTKLFRYPYLARNAALDAILKRQNLLPLSAVILSQDWKSGSGAAMVERVMNRLARIGRGVILLHDIQAKTASALPRLLRRLKQGGYRVVHIKSAGSGAGVAIARLSGRNSNRKRRALFSRLRSDARRADRKVTGSISSKRKHASLKQPKSSRSKSDRSRSDRSKAKTGRGLFGWKNEIRSLVVKRQPVSLKTPASGKTKKSALRKAKKADSVKTGKVRTTLFGRLRERSRRRKKIALRKLNKRNTKSRRRLAFKRGVINRRKNESKAEYQARLKLWQLNNKRTQAALSTR